MSLVNTLEFTTSGRQHSQLERQARGLQQLLHADDGEGRASVPPQLFICWGGAPQGARETLHVIMPKMTQ
eukprot:225566-Pelagomonas_calceolata.AAC.4